MIAGVRARCSSALALRVWPEQMRRRQNQWDEACSANATSLPVDGSADASGLKLEKTSKLGASPDWTARQLAEKSAQTRYAGTEPSHQFQHRRQLRFRSSEHAEVEVCVRPPPSHSVHRRGCPSGQNRRLFLSHHRRPPHLRLHRAPRWRPTQEPASSASIRAHRPSNRAAHAAATAGWRTSTVSPNWRRRSSRTEETRYGIRARRASKGSRGRRGRGWRRCGGRGWRVWRRRVPNGLQYQT
jgi:hypothetical protein